MAPVTFHGGPLHGVTVDADGPALHHPAAGTYRLDGASFVWDVEPVVHVRPADSDGAQYRPSATESAELRPRRRQVTRK